MTLTHNEVTANYYPLFSMSAGVSDLASLQHRTDTLFNQLIVFLQRMNAKTHPFLLTVKPCIDFKGMQRRGARAGIHFYLNLFNAQVRQCCPFSPANYFHADCL